MYGLIEKYHFSRLVGKVEKTGDFELIIDYIENKNYLPPERLSRVVDLLCNNPDGYYLYSIVNNIKNISIKQIDKIVNAIIKTDSAYYIKFLLDKLFELGYVSKTRNDMISKRLCELKNVGVLRNLLLTNKELSEEYHNLAMKIIVENDSLRNIFELARKKDLITADDKKMISSRVCLDKNPYYICLISVLFNDLKKCQFVLSMEETNDSEMIYCFIKYNSELSTDYLNILVDRLCQLNNIKYMYECLNIIHDKDIVAKRKLIKAIKDSNDMKYIVLTCFYTEDDLANQNHNFDNLYSYILDSNLYSPKELVDIYKVHIKSKTNIKNK